MKYLLFLLLANVLVAQEAAKEPAAPVAATEMQNKSIMIIDPKARASDYVRAFEFLRKDKPTQKVIIRTSETVFAGVTDLTASTGGTLLMVKILSSQGIKIQFVPIEQVLEISYSP